MIAMPRGHLVDPEWALRRHAEASARHASEQKVEGPRVNASGAFHKPVRSEQGTNRHECSTAAR